ncbi:hypothetical protein HanRHA438_Chr14g0631321 [Helianthus annuus]|nr:hypothetical protein HanRHA438_Chr14g0631321 [Helianthus annuus]
MVHLVSTRMNRVLGFVYLVRDEFTKIVAIWHPDAIGVVLKSIRFGHKLIDRSTTDFND